MTHEKKTLFFTLLKHDTDDRVEESAEFVSELPSRVAKCLDADRSSTYHTVRECVVEFVAEQHLSHAPTDFKAYCEEADIADAKGARERALTFLGRALEVGLRLVF